MKTKPMHTVYLVSLGCAKNLVDSENMVGRLMRNGWRVVRRPEQAEVIVVNTCGFIESAADESIQIVLGLANYKKIGVCRRLVVAGCLAERFREELAAELPEVDFFLGTGGFDRIAEVVQGSLESENRVFLPSPDFREAADLSTLRVDEKRHTAYIKITEGCNRHCTYCIIPKLRGRQRSRLGRDIVEEALLLAGKGIKEIVLVGQETTSYGSDLPFEESLSNLLEKLAEALQGVWIRILYMHPQSFHAALLDVMERHDNICRYFDIPIQHASDRILKKMGRNYGLLALKSLFASIRDRFPEAVLRSTVMVGFPGETEADFQLLSRFIEETAFDHLGAFEYSDFEDLAAHALPQHVDARTAKRRHDRIMSLQKTISFERNQRYIGEKLTVLVESKKGAKRLQARTAFQAPEVDGVTYIDGGDCSPGNFAEVRITHAKAYDLIGRIR